MSVVGSPGGRRRHVSPPCASPCWPSCLLKSYHTMSPSGITAAKRQGQQNLPEGPQVWLLPSPSAARRGGVCVLYVWLYLSATQCKYQSSAHLLFSSRSPSFSTCTYLSAFVNVWEEEEEGARSYFGIQLFFLLMYTIVSGLRVQSGLIVESVCDWVCLCQCWFRGKL